MRSGGLARAHCTSGGGEVRGLRLWGLAGSPDLPTGSLYALGPRLSALAVHSVVRLSRLAALASRAEAGLAGEVELGWRRSTEPEGLGEGRL